jgi:hypothetical protein
MKNSLILLILTFFLSYQTNAQNSDDLKLTCLIAGGGRNFQVIGDESTEMVNSFFAKLPDTKRKGYKWKFKNVDVPGLDKKITFQVHQGLAGKNENGSGYFNTFANDEHKKMRMAQNIESEKPAIIIYVVRGKNHVLKTKEEAKIVKDYLLSIHGA